MSIRSGPPEREESHDADRVSAVDGVLEEFGMTDALTLEAVALYRDHPRTISDDDIHELDQIGGTEQRESDPGASASADYG